MFTHKGHRCLHFFYRRPVCKLGIFQIIFFYEMSELCPSLEIQKEIIQILGVFSSRETAQYMCVT